MSIADIVEIIIEGVLVLGAIFSICFGWVNAHRVHDIHDEIELDDQTEEAQLKEIIKIQSEIIDKLKERL